MKMEAPCFFQLIEVSSEKTPKNSKNSFRPMSFLRNNQKKSPGKEEKTFPLKI